MGCHVRRAETSSPDSSASLLSPAAWPDAGLFGYGIGDMARALDAEVEAVGFDYDADPAKVEEAIVRFRPKMVTMVHCETPAGTLNPVGGVGQLVAKHDVPLFYVDAVSSAAGAPLQTDEWHVDLCLVGTQ